MRNLWEVAKETFTWERVLEGAIVTCASLVILGMVYRGDPDYLQLILLWMIALMIARERYYPNR